MVWCCSRKSRTERRKPWGNGGFFARGFGFIVVLNLSVVVTALWQNPCNLRAWRKLWSLILINAPSITSSYKQAFARVPWWHCLFMPQWRTVTLEARCSLGVNRACQSELCSVVSLHLWTMKSSFVWVFFVVLVCVCGYFSPKIISMPFFFSPTPLDTDLIVWPLLSSPFALVCSVVLCPFYFQAANKSLDCFAVSCDQELRLERYLCALRLATSIFIHSCWSW